MLMKNKTKLAVKLFLLAGLFMLPGFMMTISDTAYAQDAKLVVQGSGLPVPRFVTLKSDMVNMRVGPGREYPLAWVYKKKGLPVKVIAEFDVWRKVMDHEGVTGWIHGQLVSARRTALINEPVSKLLRRPDVTSDVVAVADKGVLMELQYCQLTGAALPMNRYVDGHRAMPFGACLTAKSSTKSSSDVKYGLGRVIDFFFNQPLLLTGP